MTLADVVRDEFALPVRAVTPGGRGALGEIWRLHLDGAPDLAAKVRATPPQPRLVALEVAHTQAMARHGVRVAASIPNRHGGYVSACDGGWMRVSEWIDGEKPDPADPLTPARLGEVLGKMHAHAAPTAHELDGSSPTRWYTHPPDIAVLSQLAAAADPRWTGRLTAFLPTLQSLSGITKAPASLVWCHRDLHPDNVLVTADGHFAVLDWDSLGPAEPAQELASVLLHWFADHMGARALPIKGFLEAYRSAGGTGRLDGLEDFAMHLADRLNFLATQLRKVIDPDAEPDTIRRATAEIEETLDFLPGKEVLAQCLR